MAKDKQSKNKKIKAGKPSVSNTYKYNAIGNKTMTKAQMIQAMKKKKK